MRLSVQEKRNWVVVAVILIIGVMFTLWDYKQWRHAELDRFGQGWADVGQAAREITRMYQGDLAEYRMRIPQEWKILQKESENRGLKIVGEGVEITSSVTERAGNLADLVDARVMELKGRGIPLRQEREYINSEKINLTVLTWQEEVAGGRAILHQEAWGMTNEKLVVWNAKYASEEWGKWNKTITAIFASIERI